MLGFGTFAGWRPSQCYAARFLFYVALLFFSGFNFSFQVLRFCNQKFFSTGCFPDFWYLLAILLNGFVQIFFRSYGFAIKDFFNSLFSDSLASGFCRFCFTVSWCVFKCSVSISTDGFDRCFSL